MLYACSCSSHLHFVAQQTFQDNIALPSRVAQTWPKSGQIRSTSGQSSSSLADVGPNKLGPHLDDFGPNSAPSGPIWSIPGKRWLNLVNFGPTSKANRLADVLIEGVPNLGTLYPDSIETDRCRPRLDQIRPSFVDFDPILPCARVPRSCAALIEQHNKGRKAQPMTDGGPCRWCMPERAATR